MKTWNLAEKSAFIYDEYSHWIDYLSFWISNWDIVKDFFTDRIYDLDTDNSNFWVVKFYDELFSIHKYNSPSWIAYQFSVSYESISIPVFVITQYSSGRSVFCNNQRGITHFYWSYFRLIELWHFSDWLINKINLMFSSCPISRMDYRFDFCSFDKVLDMPEPDKVLPYMRSNKKRRKYFKWNRLQSWDVWNKSNKTIFIRLYNKLDELNWNIKKTYLYSDIDKFKSFIRLEYEFGFKWCSWYTWSSIPELIEKAFYTSWFEKNSFWWNLYKPQLALDLSDKIDKLRYMRIFKSMAKNLHNNWIDPISVIKKIWL